MSECPSRLTLARYVVGDLSTAESSVLETHLETCAACRSDLGELKANAAAYEAERDGHLAELRSRLKKEKTGPTRRTLWSRWMPAFAMVAAVLLVIVLVLPRPTTRDVAFKGVLSYQVVVKRGGEQTVVHAGERLREGDTLRFVVTTDTAGYLSVFSADARGRVSALYPDTPADADAKPMRIERPGRTELPGSVILDDWVGREYLVLVFSEQVFDRGRVHEGIGRLLSEGQIEAVSPEAMGIRGEIGILPVIKVLRSAE